MLQNKHFLRKEDFYHELDAVADDVQGDALPAAQDPHQPLHQPPHLQPLLDPRSRHAGRGQG